MKAARWRISGMGELEYGWKRSSSVRTRLAGGGAASSDLKPNAFAACANAEDGLAAAGDLGMHKLFPRGLAGFPECIVLVVEGTCRGSVRLAVDLAHRRHMVLSAARAADSSDGAMKARGLRLINKVPRKWPHKTVQAAVRVAGEGVVE